MTHDETVFGIIGVGSIAAALVNGVMRSGDDRRVVLSPRGAEMSAYLAARFPNAVVAPDNQAVVDRCKVVLICIRPQDADTVLPSLRFRRDQTVISAMAGVSLSVLQLLTAPAMVCRSIPLPARAERFVSTPLYPASLAARALFDRLGGSTVPGDEKQFDALSTVTSTITAHLAYLATIADWLSEQGVERVAADRYVATIFSALDLAPSATESLGDLARHHATPGGINEAFAADLVSAGLPGAVRHGLERILGRLTRPS